MSFAYQRHDVPRVHLEEAAASSRALRVPHQLDADSLSAAGLRVLGNHDRSRVGTRLDQAHVATMLLPTLRGRSCMQEIIAPARSGPLGEVCARTGLTDALVGRFVWRIQHWHKPWLPVETEGTIDLPQQRDDTASTLSLYEALLLMKHCCDSAVPSPPGAVARSRGRHRWSLVPMTGSFATLRPESLAALGNRAKRNVLNRRFAEVRVENQRARSAVWPSSVAGYGMRRVPFGSI
jgi:hypothetical protein